MNDCLCVRKEGYSSFFAKAIRVHGVFFALIFFFILLFPFSSSNAAVFTQSNWGQGVISNSSDCSAQGGVWAGTECVATAPSNLSGWSVYENKDATLIIDGGGENLILEAPLETYTHTTNTDFSVRTDTSLTQSGVDDFSRGTGDVRISSSVTLTPLTFSPAWEANTAWDTFDMGTRAVPAFADFNNDGLMDIMVGTSTGAGRVYLNAGTNAAPVWDSHIAWNGPDDSNSYAAPALGDLDDDGDLDLMLGRSSGSSYGYRNVGSNTSPSWQRESAWDSADYFSYGSPALADLDGDGDLDLLQGSSPGLINMYENTGSRSSPTWTARDTWQLPTHIGGYSRPVVADLDGDGDNDLLVGISTGLVGGYINNKAPGVNPPVWERRVDWDVSTGRNYAAPALFDFDNDADLDLLVGATNGYNYGYKNIGTSHSLSGDFISDVVDTGDHQGLSSIEFSIDLPVGTSVEFDVRSGSVAIPDSSWDDWQLNVPNGGDISIHGRNRYLQYRVSMETTDEFQSPTLFSATVNFSQYPSADAILVEDDGARLAVSSVSPSWTAATTWTVSDYGQRSKPRFVDMNGDGVLDLMIGDRYGDIFGVENTGTNEVPIWVRNTSWDLENMISDWAGAGYADLDNDGDLDMMVGNGNGNTYGYRNIGSKQSPTWEHYPDWDLGNIGFNIVPDLADMDADGDYDLIVGHYYGAFRFYENTGTLEAPIWSYNIEWGDISTAGNTAPSVVDFDGDGDLDIIYGTGVGNVLGLENVGNQFRPEWAHNSSWHLITGNNIFNKYYAPDVARIGTGWGYDIILGEDTGANTAYDYTGSVDFDPTGSYLSSVIDLGFYERLTTLDYQAVVPVGSQLKVDMRTGPTPYPADDSWSLWQEDISNGGGIAGLPADRYVQYRLTLTQTTSDTSVTPFLDSISINFHRYVSTSELYSTPINTAQAGTLIRDVSWSEVLHPNTSAHIQMRVARDNGSGAPGFWTNWIGPDGTASSFWDSTNVHAGQCLGTGTISCSKVPAQLRNGINAQWVQYRVILNSNGVSTPTLHDISIEFNNALTGGIGGISVSTISGNVHEDVLSETFTVVLDSAPSSEVVIGIYSDDLTESMVSPMSVTFDSGNWNNPVTVTVTGMNDDLDDGDIAHNIVLGAATSLDANYNDRNPDDVAVTTIDNDVSSIVFTPSTGLTTNESGTTANLGVSLSTQPSGNVTVSFISDTPAEGEITSGSTLTFTPDNWFELQNVVITGQDDVVIDGAISYQIQVSNIAGGDSIYNAITFPFVSVSNGDNDAADLAFDAPYGLFTSEAGGTANVMVSLTSQPTAPVTATFIADMWATEGYIGFFDVSMTFTRDNWDQGQSLLVYGLDDTGEVDGDQTYTIVTSSFSSADTNYNGDPSDLQLTNLDNDTYDIVVTPTEGLITTEDGGTATFNISLRAIPSQDVTIDMVSSDTNEGVLLTDSITFLAGQEVLSGKNVTVKGVNDREMDTNGDYTITLNLSTSDPNYSSVVLPTISLTNLDNNRSNHFHLQNDIGRSYFGYRAIHADVNCDSIPDMLVSTNSANIYDREVYAYYGTSEGYSTDYDWKMVQSFYGSRLGQGLASVGDINRDGCEDIMIGNPSYDVPIYFTSLDSSNDQGAAYLFLGSASGLADADGDKIAEASDASWSLIGPARGRNFGSNFTAGDYNGDGWTDVAIAASRYSLGRIQQGRIYVFLNNAGSLPDSDGDGFGLEDDAAWIFESGMSYGLSGQEQGLASANVNGDEYDDLFIAVRTFSNNPSSTPREGAIFGFYGSSTLFNDASGTGVATWTDANWFAQSDQSNAYMSSVANAGDLNGDNVDDLLIGANQYNSNGAAFAFFGNASTGLSYSGLDGEAHPIDADWMAESQTYYSWTDFGAWVSPAGDFNNDGYPDVLIGHPEYKPDSDSQFDTGAIHVYAGGPTGIATTPEWSYYGRNADDRFGYVVGTLGDFDSDGYSDIYASSYSYGDGFPEQLNEGAVFVFISNVETPGISLTPMSSLQTTESGTEAIISVSLTAPPTDTVVISVATDNTDESSLPVTSLTFTTENWSVAQQIAVKGENDTLVDGDANYQLSFTVTSTTDTDYAALPVRYISLVNIDNEVTPAVSVEAVGDMEGGSGSFVFSHTGEINDAILVSYDITGSATAGVDYVDNLSGLVEIPAGNYQVSIPVQLNNDSLVESAETITATVLPDPDYDVGVPASADLVITDDDVAGVNLSPTSALVTTEAGTMVEVSAVLTSQPENNVTIQFASNLPGEALAVPSSLVFTPTNWFQAQSVNIVGQNDTSVDGDTAFVIETSIVSDDSNYSAANVDDISGINRDDDVLPTVSVSVTSSTVAEGQIYDDAFVVTRIGDISDAVDVFYSVSGTATPSDDFTLVGDYVTIPAGESSASIRVVTSSDAVFEPDETIVLELMPGSSYLLGLSASNSIVLQDASVTSDPEVNFYLDQTVGEGSVVTVRVILNKPPTSYPVVVPYTVSGDSLNPSDHNAEAGSIVINSGLIGSTSFNVVDDGANSEGDELVIFDMGTPSNATRGHRTQHIVRISEVNEPAKVDLASTQSSQSTRVIVTSGGNVTIDASVYDPNPSDTHIYSWALTNSALIDLADGDPTTFVFDPSGLIAGFYKVRLTVTDNGVPAELTNVELLLEVITTAPTLTSSDSDGDGVADNIESFADSDGDGLADYLDSSNLASHELQVILQGDASYVLQTEPGLKLSLGDIAFAAEADGAYVSAEDIAAYGAGEGDAVSDYTADDIANPNGYVDFVISELSEAGQSVKVVVPQMVAITEHSVYRKYDPVGGWRDFQEDSGNIIESALGAPGYCPPPGSVEYQSGLTAGHYCIQLTISDGGLNDADREANSIIEDPGSLVNDPEGILQNRNDENENSSRSNSSSSSGGGGFISLSEYLFILLLTVYVARRHFYKRRPI